MTRQIQFLRSAMAVIILAALLAFLAWSAVDADGPALSPPEQPTTTAPAPTGGYPGPAPTAEPYPAPYPYPAPETFLPVLLESYP